MTRQSPLIFVVDDDSRMLRSLSRLLKTASHEVSCFSAPQDFLEHVHRDLCGCVILDLRMPGMNGLDLQEALARKGCSLPIVFMSGHGDVPASVKAMKAGAIDFLPKPFSPEELLAAVGRALEKDKATRAIRLEVAELRAAHDALTPREKEVAKLVALGRLNKQIAADLDMGEKTVVVHRARAMEKLGVDSVANLVRLLDRLDEGAER